jgi:hypothetical protein
MKDLTTAGYVVSCLKELGFDCTEAEAIECLESADYDMVRAMHNFVIENDSGESEALTAAQRNR